LAHSGLKTPNFLKHGYFFSFVVRLIDGSVMRKFYPVLVAVILVAFASEGALAQFNRGLIKKNNKRIASYRGKKRGFGRDKIYTAVGVSVSALNYYGDIAPLPKRISTDISFTRPAIGVSLAHRFGPRYTLMGQFMYGTLSASDAKETTATGEGQFRNTRNLSFRNRIKELSVLAYFDLFKNESTYISRVAWTPYAYIGIAAFINNPEAQAPATDLQGNALPEAGKWVALRPLHTEGKSYGLVQPAIPFGVGARFRINEVMDLWGDIGFRYTFTDYIDDVSGNYVALTSLKSPLAQAMAYRSNEIYPNGAKPGSGTQNSGLLDKNGQPVYLVSGYGAAGDKRGSSNNRDIYMVTTIRLTYILGANFHKAKFR
jgi:hypothetical protein